MGAEQITLFEGHRVNLIMLALYQRREGVEESKGGGGAVVQAQIQGLFVTVPASSHRVDGVGAGCMLVFLYDLLDDIDLIPCREGDERCGLNRVHLPLQVK